MRWLLALLVLIGCDSTTEVPATGLVIGYSTRHEPIDATFRPYANGDDAAVELGGQGLLMTVASVRLDDSDAQEALYTVNTALLKPDGTAWARPSVRSNAVRADDGFLYLPDLYLPLAQALDRSWEHQLATLEVTAIQIKPAGPTLTSRVIVRLVAATGEYAPPSLIPDVPDSGAVGDSSGEEASDIPSPLPDTPDLPALPPPDTGESARRDPSP